MHVVDDGGERRARHGAVLPWRSTVITATRVSPMVWKPSGAGASNAGELPDLSSWVKTRCSCSMLESVPILTKATGSPCSSSSMAAPGR